MGECNTAGTKEGPGKTHRSGTEREGVDGDGRRGIGGSRVSPSTPPVMTRVSISKVSRVPMETAALAEIKKYTHPGKVVFLPLDTE